MGPVISEEARVHRVQIDVSVIDTRLDRWASVPGIPREAFELRLDGLPLPPRVRGRVEFDEVCTPPPSSRARGEPGAPLTRGSVPTLLVMVDLNFLDVQMRHNVDKALSELAGMAETQPLRVKVVAFSRRLVPLMAEFSSDPREIRRAAQALTGIRASGPARGNRLPDLNLPERPDPERAPFEPPTGGRDAFGREEAQDPDRPRPAIEISQYATGVAAEAPGGRPLIELSPYSELARRDVDPRPSLSALESLMLSHAAIPGRKALVLFTSSWFDLPEELWLTYLEGPRIAAQAGFALWTVDARGLSGSSGYDSRLLGHIATSSGGEAIRSAGRLAIGFERALAQLSCYYLFSVPVQPPREGVEHHYVDVRLDTNTYPEYWRFRLRAPSGFSLFDPSRQRQRRRLAALMEPQGHAFPEIRITTAYPDGRRNFVTPIEVSALLSDLTFLPDRDGSGLRAELSWEGVVTSAEGRQICLLGDGRRRVLRTESPPTKHPPTMLLLRTSCALPGPGVYDVRAVVEDLVSGNIGAGTATVEIADPGAGIAPVSAIRLGRNSGRDFIVDFPVDSEIEVRRDEERRAFSPLVAGEAVVPAERLLVRFVACNERDAPPVLLYRRGAAVGASVPALPLPETELLSQIAVSARAEMSGESGSCREYEGVIPENTLAPGRYGIAFVNRRLPVSEREELDRLVGLGEAGAFVEFTVATPPPRPPATPEIRAHLAAGPEGG